VRAHVHEFALAHVAAADVLVREYEAIRANFSDGPSDAR
jgi:hypothetical protein